MPSLAHLAAALKKPRALDIDRILPMHGPAIRAVTRCVAAREWDSPIRLAAGSMRQCVRQCVRQQPQ
ncbi:hypothetical protein [Burkholderia mayonis]|nr:hypothetical protein [Burkholderia mayonis]